MLDQSDPSPDWRRAETYQPLLRADAERWAFEFARRARPAADTVPADCFVAPGPQGDPEPAVIWAWRSDLAMPRLWVRPALSGHAQALALDVKALNLPVLVLGDTRGNQYVMVCDREQRLRFAVVQGDVLQGPVEAAMSLPSGGDGAGGHAFLQLAGLCERGRLASAPRRATRRTERWMQALRAHDARMDGASQRDIAQALFGAQRVREDWAAGSDHLRMRVHRLLAAAQTLIAGGYRRLLGGAEPPGDQADHMVALWRSPQWRGPKAG